MKPVIESLDQVPEPFRAEYEPRDGPCESVPKASQNAHITPRVSASRHLCADTAVVGHPRPDHARYCQP